MKRMTFGLGILGFSVILVGVVGADDKPRPAAALPPHALDKVFEVATREEEVVKELVSNDLFKKAVREALKAKNDQEARFRKNPKLADASPEQKARMKFLEVLQNEAESQEKKE